MTIRKIKIKGKIRWEIYFSTNGRGSKRYRRRFDRRPDAEAFFRRIMSEIERHDGTKTFADTTLQKEAEHWLTQKRARVSPAHYKRAVGVFSDIFARYGRLAPKAFTPALLTSIQSDELAKGNKPASVNKKIDFITSVLNYSVRQQRISFYPCGGFEKLKVPKDERGSWERAEAESFLRFAERKYPIGSSKRWVFSVYLLAINTGARAGEIWGLKAEDIAANEATILIRQQFDRVERSFRHTKGKSTRRVPCNSKLLEEIKMLLSTSDYSAGDTLFRNLDGKPICHRNFIQRAFEPDLKQWGGRRIRFHDLRHTAISLMVAAGIDLRTIQEIAGHADWRVTSQYSHALKEKLNSVADQFRILPSQDENPPPLRLVISR